jgi:FAD:protein FMN transferase
MLDKNKSFDRRSFLKYSGMLGAGVLFSGLMPVCESVAFNRKLYKITRTRLTMGTFAAITLLHPSRCEADDVMGMAFDEMDRVSRLFDRYQADSPIGRLNYDGFLSHLPPEVLHVISRSLYFHNISGGSFDITVKPLVDLYKNHFAAYQNPPSDEKINSVLNLVDASAIRLTTHSVEFAKKGMGLTLDGIAKGYVIDCGLRVIKRHGIKHGLINAGGDIRTMGGKDRKTPWKVAIQNPNKNDSPINTITMVNGAIATSGNYEVYFDKEKLYHHIITPQSGRPALTSASVTVLTANAMDADALSTAVFVAGPEAGKKIIENLPGAQCLILSSRGENIRSAGWPSV